MAGNHGVSPQILKGPLAVSPDYPALVVDADGREICLCGLAGDTQRGGAVIAGMLVRLFNETDVDLSAPAEVADPAVTEVVQSAVADALADEPPADAVEEVPAAK